MFYYSATNKLVKSEKIKIFNYGNMKRDYTYAKERFSNMYSKDGKAFKGRERFAFTKIQIEYIKDVMYVSWLQNMQKFRKNDIYDLFFLGCADYIDKTPTEHVLIDKTTYLLSFDKKLAGYIEE